MTPQPQPPLPGHGLRQRPIGGGLAVGDLSQQRPHLLPEGGACQMKRRQEVRLPARKIDIQPPLGLLQHRRLLRSVLRCAGEILLPRQPQACQALLVRRQQQFPHRGSIVLPRCHITSPLSFPAAHSPAAPAQPLRPPPTNRDWPRCHRGCTAADTSQTAPGPPAGGDTPSAVPAG